MPLTPQEELELLELEEEEEQESSVSPLENASSSSMPTNIPQIGRLEASLRGGLQGASFGLSDEVIGGLRTAGAKLWGQEDSITDLYRKYRDIERQREATAAEQEPLLYHGADVATSLAMPFGGSIKLASKGASILDRLHSMGKLGAKVGALAGFGRSEADLTKGDVGGVLKDTATGAGMGYGLGTSLDAATSGIGTIGSKFIQGKGEKLKQASRLFDKAAKIKPLGEVAPLSRTLAGATGLLAQGAEKISEVTSRIQPTGVIQAAARKFPTEDRTKKIREDLEKQMIPQAQAGEKKLEQATNNLYDADDNELTQFAQVLRDKGFEKYGDTLEDAVRTGNTQKKHAAMFAVMQRPDLRQLLSQ